jgi:hypothetical protein
MPKNELVFSDDVGFGRTQYRTGKAGRILRRAELDLFSHGLDVAVDAECEIQEAHALADVMRASLDVELDLLEWGLHRANGSVAKTELVAHKVNMLSTINDSRINRRYGR